MIYWPSSAGRIRPRSGEVTSSQKQWVKSRYGRNPPTGRCGDILFGAVLGFAVLLGAVTDSWLIFVVVTAIGTALMIHAGEMRLKANDRNVVHSVQRKGRCR